MDNMYPAVAGSPVTTLSAGITETDLTIPINAPTALPPAPNLATIYDNNNFETVLYTAKDSSSITVDSRALEGVARAWGEGTKISRLITAKDHNDVKNNLESHASRHGNGGNDQIGQLDTTDNLSDLLPRDSSRGMINDLDLNGFNIVNVNNIEYIDTYGVEYDEINDTYKRIASAEGMQPDDFNDLSLYSSSKICNLADDGTVNSYIDDPDFAWDGSNGQVMREIDKFWYKHEDIENGYRRFISLSEKDGFKVHPLFVVNGNVIDKAYCGVFEAVLEDVSAGSYEGNGVTYDYSNDKLASVAGYQPVTGDPNSLTRSEARQMATNRGDGWEQNNHPGREALNLLHLIQYANYDMQTTISEGITNLDSGSNNHAQNTGHTTSLNGESGEVVITSLENGATGASETYAMSFLGIENIFGNVWEWVDGVNINDHTIYIAPGPPYQDDVFSDRYQPIGVALPQSNGYVSKVARNNDYDYGTLPAEANGNSSTYLCDYYYQNTGEEVLRVGGRWYSGWRAGPAYRSVNASSADSHRDIGSRLWFRK